MKDIISNSKKTSWLTTENFATAAFIILMVLAPSLSLAAGDDFTTKDGKACQFIANIHTILNLMSVVVVTIAIIFAGYQIAFAHKRIADVAPVLIGGVLIGAAGQIAKMLVTTPESCVNVASIQQVIQYFV